MQPASFPRHENQTDIDSATGRASVVVDSHGSNDSWSPAVKQADKRTDNVIAMN